MSRNIKTLAGILIIIIIWGIIFFIDYNKVSNLKIPIFVIQHANTYYGLGYKVNVEEQNNINGEAIDGTVINKIEMYMFNKLIVGAVADTNENNLPINSEQNESTKIQNDYKTKIEDLPKEYSFLNALKDKCVITVHNKTIYNKDELDKFLENVENYNPDFIRCISFTIEGDMLITDVEFEGNNIYKVTTDYTRDEWSAEEDRTYKYGKYTKLEKQEDDEQISIVLSNPIEGDRKEIFCTGYDKNAKIVNNYEVKFLLDINKSEKQEVQKITIDKLDQKYDYDIYYYGLQSAKIEIKDEKLDLKEALLTDKVTIEQIIEQAEKDSKAGIIGSDMYKDGGSMIYYYYTYAIIKSNSLDGNRDIYIGIPQMSLNKVR